MITIFNGRRRTLGEGGEQSIFYQIDVKFLQHINKFPNSQLHVFLAITAHTNAYGWCCPSVDRLAKCAGISASTVQDILKKLEQVEIDGHPVLLRVNAVLNGHSAPNHYLIFPGKKDIEDYGKVRFRVDANNRAFEVINEDGTTADVPLPDSGLVAPAVAKRNYTYKKNPQAENVIEVEIGAPVVSMVDGENQVQTVTENPMPENRGQTISNNNYIKQSGTDVPRLSAKKEKDPGKIPYSSLVFLPDKETCGMGIRERYELSLKLYDEVQGDDTKRLVYPGDNKYTSISNSGILVALMGELFGSKYRDRQYFGRLNKILRETKTNHWTWLELAFSASSKEVKGDPYAWIEAAIKARKKDTEKPAYNPQDKSNTITYKDLDANKLRPGETWGERLQYLRHVLVTSKAQGVAQAEIDIIVDKALIAKRNFLAETDTKKAS